MPIACYAATIGGVLVSRSFIAAAPGLDAIETNGIAIGAS